VRASDSDSDQFRTKQPGAEAKGCWFQKQRGRPEDLMARFPAVAGPVRISGSSPVRAEKEQAAESVGMDSVW
jgi:hypothetical protein